MSVTDNISKEGGTLWQNSILVIYKKEVTYEILSDNIDGYKCTLLVGQLLLDVHFIKDILRIKFLMRIYYSISYIESLSWLDLLK